MPEFRTSSIVPNTVQYVNMVICNTVISDSSTVRDPDHIHGKHLSVLRTTVVPRQNKDEVSKNAGNVFCCFEVDFSQ